MRDGWLIAAATLEDGSQVDLHNNGQPVSWEKPQMLSDRYGNTHFSHYVMNLKPRTRSAANHRRFYVDYLRRVWQERYGTRHRIQQIDLYIIVETTKPDPEVAEQERVLLFQDKPTYRRGRTETKPKQTH